VCRRRTGRRYGLVLSLHLHVRVGGEECDDPVGHAGGRLEQQLAVVAHGGGLGAQVELGREWRLVGATRDDERADDVSREGHCERVHCAWLEAEDLGVHVDGREGAGSDDHRLEPEATEPTAQPMLREGLWGEQVVGRSPFEDWLHRDGGIVAAELEERIGQRGRALVVRLDDDAEALASWQCSRRCVRGRSAGVQGAEVLVAWS